MERIPYVKARAFFKGLEVIRDIEYRDNYSQNVTNAFKLMESGKYGFKEAMELVIPHWQERLEGETAEIVPPEVYKDMGLAHKQQLFSQREIRRITHVYSREFFDKLGTLGTYG